MSSDKTTAAPDRKRGTREPIRRKELLGWMRALVAVRSALPLCRNEARDEHDQAHDEQTHDVGVLVHCSRLRISMMAPSRASIKPAPRVVAVQVGEGQPPWIAFSSTPSAATRTPASRRNSPAISAAVRRPLIGPSRTTTEHVGGAPWL